MLIVDGHQNLAWAMATFGRDYTRPARETRRLERGTAAPAAIGDTLLGWPEYLQGQIALVFAAVFASPARWQRGSWDTQVYRDIHQAHALYRTQVDLLNRLADEHPDKFRLVFTASDLEEVLGAWEQTPAQAPPPVGLLLAMKNAEPVREPAELELWWKLGIRLVGPAWAGARFSGDRYEPGPLTRAGLDLLEVMADLGMGLDLTHMAEQAAIQALDVYPGIVVATHANAGALVRNPDARFLTDRLIHGLIERQGVIGLVPINDFLRQDWQYLGGRPAVSLDLLAAQIDYICQIAGDARHVALGSNFDGGYGLQAAPAEMDSIAALQKMIPYLQGRGYTDEDIAAILGLNWLAVLRRILPKKSNQ
jgi:membrane dipeptidase